MPSLSEWLTFVAASEALLILPGPTVLMVISYALSGGRRAALMTVPGVALGDFTAMSVSFLGLGAVLASSAQLFMLLKLAGALYLAYLGIRALTQPARMDDERPPERPERTPASIAIHAFAITALNPKGIAFYVAFFPLFLDPHDSFARQLAVYGGTFLTLAIINATLYALLAGEARRLLSGWGARVWLNRVSGCLFLLCAGLLGFARRA
jgi:threonine/homoserine/homoserine lactone efflux protein